MTKTKIVLVKQTLPQNPNREVFVPNYKEPTLPIKNGFGWYGLQSYNARGKLMCCECGSFYDSLANHIRVHKLIPVSYKAKYGLMSGAILNSESNHNKIRNRVLSNTEAIKKFASLLNKIRPLAIAANKNRPKQSVEFLNKYDSCPAQLLRRLIDLSKIYGNDISSTEACRDQPGLLTQLQRTYGSFNKAKQLAKLIVNANVCPTQFTKQIIAEDMCRFYSNHNKWPGYADYRKWRSSGLVCSEMPVRDNGGMTVMRQEAQMLLEKQKANIKWRETQLPQIVGKIEMQFAGTARR